MTTKISFKVFKYLYMGLGVASISMVWNDPISLILFGLTFFVGIGFGSFLESILERNNWDLTKVAGVR